jgi:uncharacterized delta-60 repeat protein
MPIITSLSQKLLQALSPVSQLITLSRDTDFPTTSIAGSAVQILSIALDPDGSMYIGGLFEGVDGFTHGNIAKLNSNGTRATFNTGAGFNRYVSRITYTGATTIYVTGLFTTYFTQTLNRLAKVSSGGARGSGIPNTSGFDNLTQDVKVQSDGKLIVVGNFTTYAGVAAGRVVRLNANGTRDATFNYSTINIINACIIQSDGKILLGGLSGLTRRNSNGTADTGFTDTPGSYIICMALQSDGKILVGGSFTTWNGNTHNRIVRLNANGTIDSDFNPGTGFNNAVRAIAVESDGKILVGGSFTTFNGNTHTRIVRLNSDGSLASKGFSTVGFVGTLGPNFSDVFTIVIQPDNKILIGGAFNRYDGESVGSIIRFNNN